jgi:hypothetical protein
VGRFGDGCLEHQEHPDRSGRRHQDQRQLVGDTKNVISTSGASPSFAIFGDAGHAVAQAGDRPAFSYTSIKDYVTPEQIAIRSSHVQPARQDYLRAGDLDLRRHTDAGIA